MAHQMAHTCLRILNPGPGSSWFDGCGFLNNKFYFRGSSELWRTDGTPDGTVKLATFDDYVEECYVSATELFILTTQYEFDFDIFDYVYSDWQLWRHDGTDADPVKIKDLGISSGFTYIDSGMLGNLFFLQVANDEWRSDQTAGELWISDGTTAGTKKIKDFIGINNSPNIVFDNKLMFSAKTAAEGWEPWVTDGTSAGTNLLVDAKAGTGSSGAIREGGVIGSDYFFFVNDGTCSTLYKTDGSSAGTSAIKSLSRSVDYGYVFNSTLFFAARSLFNGCSGVSGNAKRLWKSDGTAAGTQEIKVLSGNSHIGNFFEFNNELHMNVRFTQGIWKTDGTSAGTVEVFSIDSDLEVYHITSDGKLFYTGGEVYGGRGLWVDNFGAENPTLLKKPYRVLNAIKLKTAVGGNKFFFLGWKNEFDYSLWSIEDDQSTFLGDWRKFIDFEVLNGRLIFAGATSANSTETELWITDGSASGPTMIKKINSGANSDVRNLVKFGDYIYFQANDGNGNALWRTDGTESGTVLVSSSISGNFFHALKDSIIFFGSNLKRILDTFDQTQDLSAITSISGHNGKYFMTPSENKNVVFTSGSKPWITDGTPSGTFAFSDAGNAVATVGNAAFYEKSNQTYRYDLSSASDAAFPVRIDRTRDMLLAENKLYFFNYDYNAYPNLYITNGATDNPDLVTSPVSESHFYNGLIRLGNRAIFNSFSETGNGLEWIVGNHDNKISQSSISYRKASMTNFEAFQVLAATEKGVYAYAVKDGQQGIYFFEID